MRGVARHHRVGRHTPSSDRTGSAKPERTFRVERVANASSGTHRTTDLPRDQEARLQRVRVGADEVVEDLFIALVGTAVALVLDIEADEHVGLEQLDDPVAGDRPETVDVDQLALMDGDQVGALLAGRDGGANVAGAAARAQHQSGAETAGDQKPGENRSGRGRCLDHEPHPREPGVGCGRGGSAGCAEVNRVLPRDA